MFCAGDLVRIPSQVGLYKMDDGMVDHYEKTNNIIIEVNLASQAHNTPHVGLPHKAPVIIARKVKSNPIGMIHYCHNRLF